MSIPTDPIGSLPRPMELVEAFAQKGSEDASLDPTEAMQKKAAELAQSLAVTRATLQATWDGILVTDDRGQVTEFNQKYVSLWRVPADVIAARDHRRIVEHVAQLVTDPK